MANVAVGAWHALGAISRRARAARRATAALRTMSWLVGMVLSAAAEVAGADLGEARRQYASAGHVVAFQQDGYVVSNGTYAMRVTFEGGAVSALVPATGPEGTAGDPMRRRPLGHVAYAEVWPGIGVVYDGPGHGIVRSTWTVAPGSDPARIRLRYNRPVRISEAGELAVSFVTGTAGESRPIAWQDVDGRRVPVEVAFRQIGDNVIGFSVGDYRRDVELTIDPTLTWNTFLGGSGPDYGYGIAVDSDGNVYVVGRSDATWGSPLKPYQGVDAFVAKLAPSGTLIWNTFLGGTSTDAASDVAADTAGNVYVIGWSLASWGDPLSPHMGNLDAFVARLTPAGALVWNTFLGTSLPDSGGVLHPDGHGGLYVAGQSAATWGSPLRPHSGVAALDVFVARMTSEGVLTWNTFLGGTGSDAPGGLVVDTDENLFVVGESATTWGSPLLSHSALDDAFVAALTPAGELVWNTFLGGGGNDSAGGIGVLGGDLYVAGNSTTGWGSPLQPHAGGVRDAYAARLTTAGTLVWLTFVGGSGNDSASDLLVTAEGRVYLAGDSTAAWGDPVRPYTASTDVYVAEVTPAGTLAWNTFLGGAGLQRGGGIAGDSSGNAYVVGHSTATWGSPVRPYASMDDVFVAQVDASPLPTRTPTATVTATATPTRTGTATRSATVTRTVTVTWTSTATRTVTSTRTATSSATPLPSATATASATEAATASATPTHTPTPSAEDTATTTATSTETPNATATVTTSLTPTATPTVTPSPSPAATAATNCPVLPSLGCVSESSATLQISSGNGPAQRKLRWKWRTGDTPVAVADLGTPLTTTSYTLCLYDETAAVPALKMQVVIAAAGSCGVGPCWKALGSKGFSYKNGGGHEAGITRLLLKAGGAERARILIKGAGADLALPTAAGGAEFLDHDVHVTVQLRASDTVACWTSRFATATKNSATQYKAKAP